MVIRGVHAGQHPVKAEVESQLAQRATGPTLTTREIQVLELVAQGFRNKEIAAALGISDDTAHAHIRNILAKLKVNDRTAAITVALRRGIIHL